MEVFVARAGLKSEDRVVLPNSADPHSAALRERILFFLFVRAEE